ncbi:CoA-transferase [Dietzia kunjamensis]|uniref:CoA-transferase subunit beta n=1 Tax=Dietzia TaxID=37914 RepID=UPI000804942E|nr:MULTISPECIES: CoA-transferase [Dietzia]MBB1018213.1 CoA-transferase [Dietzia sp. DQ11-71]MDJ0421367.1 CoA-transferase [Dietzia kunjamensis]OAV79521.1 CoA-transferase [Dietzia sp. 111N12-1]
MSDVTTESATTQSISRAEYCAVACAEIFAGAGEIFASPMTPMATIGARLARLTTEPDLLITDGEYRFLGQTPPLGKTIDFEGYIPFPRVFDVLQAGTRHVVMGANQIDRFGNQNLSAFGDDVQKPTRQMFGLRGAPGNSINHATSYWVGKHSSRVFTDKVDVVCGVGYDRYTEGDPAFRYHHIHRVVSNLGVFDFGGADRSMRAISLHPGVTADEVAENTGFEIEGLADAAVTRDPSAEELRIIREVLDPRGFRDREVPAA